jgi:1-acyl-sn-glycerol-3-phosphate acyltransferase
VRRLIEELVFRPIVLLYARPRVTGVECLDSTAGPYLFVSNHHSYLDTGLFKLALPRWIRGRIAPAMTTRYHRIFFGEIPGSRWRHALEGLQARMVISLFGTWPLPETVGFRSSLDYAGELADGGRSLLIFPEGRHVKEGQSMPFRGGIGIFARDLRLPVVPAAVAGTRKVLPDDAWWLRFGRTRLALGPPMRFASDADPAEITRRLEQAVRELQREIGSPDR